MRTVIVGAGPTGATLAYLLARRGLDVVLLEREDGFGRVFRGEGLMPSGVAALRSLGLDEDRLRAVPTRIVDDLEYYADREPVMAFEEPARHSPDAVRILSQEHLLQVLVDAASAFPSFSFRPGFAVRDVRRVDGRTVVEGQNGERLEADLVVGADGRASMIRPKAGLALDRTREASPHNHDALWCSVPLPPWLVDRTVFYAFLARHHVGTMYPTATGALRVGWLFPRDEPDVLDRHPIDEVAKLAPEHLATWLRAQRSQASEPALFRVMLGICPKWWTPGVLLLGDAAHPMNAIRAQGINLGLRDAIVAANHLVPLAESGDSAALDRACAAIQAERAPEIEAAQKLQLSIARVPPVLFWPWARRWVLPPLMRTGIPQRVQTWQERVLRDGLGEVVLRV